jgi:NADPH-dependent 2,4-dienoyl-CoA reductase/sulfur reductase-like enzyme
VVVGGSAIGVETASELAGRGISTTIIEKEMSILPVSLDADVAKDVTNALQGEGVTVITSSPLEKVIGDGRVSAIVAGGVEIETDLVVMATGVVPDVDLAKSMGVELGENGGVITDGRMATTVEGVFAAGDCVDTLDLVTEKPSSMRLAGIATRQGRVAGIIMAGGEASFPGSLGSWVVATHTFHAGGSGLTDAHAGAEGMDTVSVKVQSHIRPHYISGDRLTIKLTAESRSGRLLGGQVFGPHGVSETVNYIALAVTSKLAVGDLTTIDWCYAPLASECVNPMASAADALLRRMSRGR